MKTVTATTARARFGKFLDESQRQPVRVTRHGHVVGVMVNAADYEAARRFYTNRLLQTMKVAAENAERAGLTSEILDDLLSDES